MFQPVKKSSQMCEFSPFDHSNNVININIKVYFKNNAFDKLIGGKNLKLVTINTT